MILPRRQTAVVGRRHVRSSEQPAGIVIHPDGRRVAASGGRQPEGPRLDKAVFVLNFFDELRRIAPPKKP
jgi:hypothetical protein